MEGLPAVALALISLVLNLTVDELEMVALRAVLVDVLLHLYVLIALCAVVLGQVSVEVKYRALSLVEENVAGV